MTLALSEMDLDWNFWKSASRPRKIPQSSSFFREMSALEMSGLPFAYAAAVSAAPFGMGGKTGVDTESDAVNFSNEDRGRRELPDGLLGDPRPSSGPFATTASIGRRGRL
jgi:hypothetical protein